MNASPLDLTELNASGLRRGFTTGTCATASVQAALWQLLYHKAVKSVAVKLPNQENFLNVPIDDVRVEPDGAVCAAVVKDAGDDPDQTHRARLFARVQRNETGRIIFKRGAGVGLVTEPGLQVAVGEPAINPGPRAMMIQAVRDLIFDNENPDEGFDLEIGCENGEEIAKRTFNPRLGILGGISILGTTGIVEPKSMAAFQASIEIYIRVALAQRPQEIVLAPGNLGQRFARAYLQLPLKQVVQMSNFVGFAFSCVQNFLQEIDYELPHLWLVGHPGKLVKILTGAPNTHSQQSDSALPTLLLLTEKFDFSPQVICDLKKANTVDHFALIMHQQKYKVDFWRTVETQLADQVAKQMPRVKSISVKLFQMDGRPLGGET